MSLDKDKTSQLEQLIESSLNIAESIWRKVEPQITENQLRAAIKSIPSQIPGYPLASRFSPQVDQFIAMMLDMRDSTKHLLNAISAKTTKVNQLERIFYETSALLPSTALAISFEKGSVTEYLGDGVLALFQVQELQPAESIYAAYRAAKSCLGEVRYLVNLAIESRYSLPPLDVGVGLAMSKAIVTVVGTVQFEQPKAIGECVYRATKLSGGKNEIMIDRALYDAWPRTNDGALHFIPKQSGDLNGYVVTYKHQQ